MEILCHNRTRHIKKNKGGYNPIRIKEDMNPIAESTTIYQNLKSLAIDSASEIGDRALLRGWSPSLKTTIRAAPFSVRINGHMSISKAGFQVRGYWL